jgi:hypothetical protein
VLTVTVTAVNDPPVAAAQSFSAQANMRVSIPAAGLLAGATDPDTGDPGYTFTPTADALSITATSPAGGTITSLDTATGSFAFDPPPGATGNVTFQYQICDNGTPGSQCSAPATATVSVSGPVIWFVDPSLGSNGTGRLSAPFNTLASAAAVDASGHRIFLYTGTATSGITLNTNEWLIGQGVSGASFDALFGITPPSGTIARPSIGGTRPTVQGNVVMASTDAVRGLNVLPPSGTAGLSAAEATVSTTNAVALNLVNSDGTFSFTTVSANGGASGIVWSNATPATGSLTIAGTGTAGSGGTIQGTTGDGIALTNARNVSLRRMLVQNNLGSGINGSSVTNFDLLDSTVDNNGDNGVADEAGIRFTNLTGTATISNSTVANSVEDNARIINSTGTLSQLTVTGSTFRDTDAGTGNIGLLIQADGGSITADITGSSFLRNRSTGLDVITNNNGTVDVALGTASAGTGGTFQDNYLGAEIVHNSSGTLTFGIRNASFSQPTLVGAASPINLNKGAAATGTMSGTVANNTITNGGSLTGPGIRVVGNGAAGTLTVAISSNTISQVQNYGIQVLARDGNGPGHTVNATIRNNSVSLPTSAGAGSLEGIRVDAGAVSADTTKVCADIAGNTSTTVAGLSGVRVRQRFTGTTFTLEGYGGAATDDAAVASFLSSNNNGAVASADHGGAGFGTTANCPEPAP